MNIETFFSALWDDFVHLAPQAAVIRDKLIQRGECVVNDHVAFRTFNRAPLNIDTIEASLKSLGYQRLASYHFKQKHLDAWSYYIPDGDIPDGEIRDGEQGAMKPPLIFLSELNVEALSLPARKIVDRLISDVKQQYPTLDALLNLDEAFDKALLSQGEDSSEKASCAKGRGAPLFSRGRLWPMITYTEYQQLQQESEYAAWLALHGYHANHFTISLNHLNELKTVESMLAWVESEGFLVNASGGRVKGSAQLMLEQGSTMADQIEVVFACGEKRAVPGAFYEFALRYPDQSGRLFNGFVEGNADKIFESTHQ